MQPNLSPKECLLISTLETPQMVQGFLNALPYDTAPTIKSFRETLQRKTADCLEGAIFAAVVLDHHGFKPLVLSLHGEPAGHAVYVYKTTQGWGAIGKSQSPNLESRIPIYKDISSLAMSYDRHFGEDVMYGFAGPIDLTKYLQEMATSNHDLVAVDAELRNATYTSTEGTTIGKRYRLNPNGGVIWSTSGNPK